MDNKNIYDTGLYLRLSRDDADVDGGKRQKATVSAVKETF